MLPPEYYTIDFNGYSMYPALQPGDRLVIRCVAPEQISPGDMLVRRNGDNTVMVHRLVHRISVNRGITKGDTLSHPDPDPIVFNKAVERVEAIIREGRLIVLSNAMSRWRSRLSARYSRLGVSAASVRQYIKTAMIHRPGRTPDFNKSALIGLLKNECSATINDHDWPGLLAAMDREGVAGLAYLSYKDRHLPHEAGRYLADRYHGAVVKNLACQSFLEKLEKFLGAEKIRVMTLKGASLFHQCYSGVGQRPMQDVDLMVQPEDLPRFEQILVSIGFRQNRWRKELFDGPMLNVDLHVHPLHTDRINGRNNLLSGDIASIWHNSLPWREDFDWIRRPDDVDNILLLSLHLLKHAYSRLIWLEDVFRLLERYSKDDMRALFNRAAELGCTRTLLYTIYILDVLYGLSRMQVALTDRIQPLFSAVEKGLLLFSISDGPVPLTAPLLEILAMRGLKKRFYFTLESLFPNRKVLRTEFGAVRPAQRLLFFPLRLLQILKLLAEHILIMIRILFRAGK